MRAGQMLRTMTLVSRAVAGPFSVAMATFRAVTTDRVSLAAAGSGFWATTALFPAISALVSIYGLLFDPLSAASQLGMLSDFLPGPAYELVDQRVQQLVHAPSRELSAQFLVGVGLTLWSASTGTKAVLSALNIAYDTPETRGIIRFQLTGLALTVLAMLGAVMAIAVVVLLPAAIILIGLSRFSAALLHTGGLALIVSFFAGAVTILYRYGPSRGRLANAHTFPGVMAATVIWLSASGALSYYIGHLGNFGATYGSIGAVIGIMLWFYLSAYSVLLGAELNAQLESRALECSTQARPDTQQ